MELGSFRSNTAVTMGCYIRGTLAGTMNYIYDWLIQTTEDGRSTMQTKMQTTHTTDKTRRRTQ